MSILKAIEKAVTSFVLLFKKRRQVNGSIFSSAPVVLPVPVPPLPPSPPSPPDTPTITVAPTIAISGTTVMLGAATSTSPITYSVLYGNGIPLLNSSGQKVAFTAGVGQDLVTLYGAQLSGQILKAVADAGSGVVSVSTASVTFPVQGTVFTNSALTPGASMASLGLLTAGTFTVASDGRLHTSGYGTYFVWKMTSGGIPYADIPMAAISSGTGVLSAGLFIPADGSFSVRLDLFGSGACQAVVGTDTFTQTGFGWNNTDIVRVQVTAPGKFSSTVLRTGQTLNWDVTGSANVPTSWAEHTGLGVAATPEYTSEAFPLFSIHDPLSSGGLISTPVEPVTGYTLAGRSISIPGTYSVASPASADLSLYDGSGNQVLAPTALTTPSGGTLAGNITLPLDHTHNGQTYGVLVRLKDGSGSVIGTASSSITLGIRAPIKATEILFNFGANWNFQPLARNAAEQAEWRAPDNGYYRGSAVSLPAGDRLLPLNSAGVITAYASGQSSYVLNVPVAVGTHDIVIPSGMTLSSLSVRLGSGSVSGSSVTMTTQGQIQFALSGTIPAAGINAVYGSGARNLTVLQRGDANPSRRWRDDIIAMAVGVSQGVRWLEPLRANYTNSRNLTTGDAPQEGPWGLTPFGIPLSAIKDFHNQALAVHGKALKAYVNMHDQADNSAYTEAATVLSGLSAPIVAKPVLSNETWNVSFVGTVTRLWLKGYNAGLSPANPGTHNAAFLNPLTSSGTTTDRSPATPLAAGTEVMVHTDNLDFYGIWKVKPGQTATADAAGAIPTTSAGNSVWAYVDGNGIGLVEAGAAYKAGLYDQVITAFKAVFPANRREFISEEWSLLTAAQIKAHINYHANAADITKVAVGGYPTSFNDTNPQAYDGSKAFMANYTGFDPSTLDQTKQAAFLNGYYPFAQALCQAKHDAAVTLKHALYALSVTVDLEFYECHALANGSTGVFSGFPTAVLGGISAAIYQDGLYNGSSTITPTGQNRMQALQTFDMQQHQQREGAGATYFAAFNGGVDLSVSGGGNNWPLFNDPSVDTQFTLAMKAAQTKLAAAQAI